MSTQAFATYDYDDAPVPVPEIAFDILHTEVGNARRLLEKYGDEICFHIDRNMWLVWQKTHWVLDSKGRHVAMLLKRVLQEMRNEANATVEELTPVVAGFRDVENPTPEELPVIQRLTSAQKL